ncbi:MAG: hypothetical protein K6E97_11000 [Treponema sp.]|nr:hypothetical protein [Treponema sp.]
MKKFFYLLTVLLILAGFISCKTDFNFGGNIRIVLPGSNERSAENYPEFLKTISHFTLKISKASGDILDDDIHEEPKIVKSLTIYKNTEYRIKLTPGNYYFDLNAITKNGDSMNLPLVAEDGEQYQVKKPFHVKRGENILKFEFANVEVTASAFAEIVTAVQNAVPFQLTTITVSQDINAEDESFDDIHSFYLDYGKKIIIKSDNSGIRRDITFPHTFSVMFNLEDMASLSLENIECIWNKQGDHTGDLAAPFYAYDRSELTLKDVTLSLKMDTARTIIQSSLYPEIVFDNVIINDYTTLEQNSEIKAFRIIDIDETERDFNERGVISLYNLTCNSQSGYTDFQIRTGNVEAINDEKGIRIGLINKIEGLNSLYVKDYMSITGQGTNLDGSGNKINLYLYDNGDSYKNSTATNKKNTNSDVSPWKKDIFELIDIENRPELKNRIIGDDDQVYKKIIKGDNTSLQPFSLLDNDLTLNNQPFTASGEVGIYSFNDRNITINSGSFIKADDSIDFNIRGQITIKGIGDSKITFIKNSTNSDDCIIDTNTITTLENVIFAGDGQAKDIKIYQPLQNENITQLVLHNSSISSILMEEEEAADNGPAWKRSQIYYSDNVKGTNANGKIFITLKKTQHYLNQKLVYINPKENDKKPNQIFEITNFLFGLDNTGTVGKKIIHFYESYSQSEAESSLTQLEYIGTNSLDTEVIIPVDKDFFWFSGQETGTNELLHGFTASLNSGVTVEINKDIPYNKILCYKSGNSNSIPVYKVKNGATLKVNNLFFDVSKNGNMYSIDNYGTTELNNVYIQPNASRVYDIITHPGSNLTINELNYTIQKDNAYTKPYGIDGYSACGIKVYLGSKTSFKGQNSISNITVLDSEITSQSEPLFVFYADYTNIKGEGTNGYGTIPNQLTINMTDSIIEKMITNNIPFYENKNINNEPQIAYTGFSGVYYLEKRGDYYYWKK